MTMTAFLVGLFIVSVILWFVFNQMHKEELEDRQHEIDEFFAPGGEWDQIEDRRRNS